MRATHSSSLLWERALRATVAALGLTACTAQADWLIQGATVIDGSGRPGYVADVALREGRIAAIGALTPRVGDQLVDGTRKVLAPGFIDPHSHHDRGLLEAPQAVEAVSQGITTIAVGVDGESDIPLSAWIDTHTRKPAALNIASFSGHGALRRTVMGADYKRAARPEEIAKMEALLEADMAAGALGLASGLEYDPGIYSATAELIALAKVAQRHGGIYASHVRSEDVKLDEAQEEVATIAREAKIPAQLSHLKISLIDRWGEAPKMLARLDAWRAEGLDITADVYPYTYWQSTITSVFPKRDFDNIESARHVLEHVARADGIIFTKYAPEPRYVGKTVADIAKERNVTPEQTLLDLIHAAYPDGNIDTPETRESVMGVSMREDDVAAFLAWEHAAVCSDGGLGGGHPRGAGAFPRYLRHYVLDKDPAALPDAIHRMTAKSAARLGLADRGFLAQGRAADVVLLDPATVRDNATIANPTATASGIAGVWVNGERVWDGARATGALPGQVLKRGGG